MFSKPRDHHESRHKRPEIYFPRKYYNWGFLLLLSFVAIIYTYILLPYRPPACLYVHTDRHMSAATATTTFKVNQINFFANLLNLQMLRQ